jgi:hypothetical protein
LILCFFPLLSLKLRRKLANIKKARISTRVLVTRSKMMF